MDPSVLAEWVALNAAQGIGARLYASLLEAFGSPGEVLKADRAALEKTAKLPGKVIGSLLETRMETGFQEIEKAEREGIQILILPDESYPKRLKEIYDPPPVLYVKGDFSPKDEVAVAVVGCRQCSSYGRLVTTRLVEELVRDDLCIVSGMARGIDTYAHWAALQSQGRTLAVWGSGLLCCYPEENRDLAGRIAERGALISSFPLEARPDQWTFPVRNRIISGLSLGVIVVEAGTRSGALITAEMALEQGRDVFAVPGNITSRTSLGTNHLIKQGAKVVQCGQDVSDELFMRTGLRAQPKPVAMSAVEAMVMDAINDGADTVDAVLEITGISMDKLLGILTVLEMRNVVAKNGSRLQPLA